MTTAPKFGFYFEKAGRGPAQGAVHPAAQFFEGSDLEVSLARETAQNAIDAAIGSGPVTMVFDLREMTTEQLPGIHGLRPHFESVVRATDGKHGNEAMVRALEASRSESLPVLRISDYGTKGLHGSESTESHDSPLSALTRGAGISANDGVRGGSFGIGSAVGPLASDLCTVFYTSLPSDPVNAEVVFAGYSQLASHKDANGDWRTADGFFTELDNQNFHYLRNPGAFGPFPLREEPGTDIYIPAYRMASKDPFLHKIRDAFVLNFMVAIDRDRLIVHGYTENGNWTLDSSTLESYAEKSSEALARYRAIKDPEPIIEEHKGLGEIRLYINIDDSLDRSYHTITMRAPLMKIETYKHTSISTKYAAVFECSSPKGNKLLRDLEPPEHTKWDPGRADHGEKYVRYIKKFIKDGLKSRIKHQVGDQLEIKGLERYLPSELLGPATYKRGGSKPVLGDGSDQESSTVQGKPYGPVQGGVESGPKRAVSVKVSASGGGSEEVEKGKDGGGGGVRSNSRTGFAGDGKKSEGKSRINGGNITFRSWYAGSGKIEMVVSSADDAEGDIELVPLGPGGSVEDKYILPITSVTAVTREGVFDLVWTNNTIHNLKLNARERVRIRVSMDTEKRYRLGVK